LVLDASFNSFALIQSTLDSTSLSEIRPFQIDRTNFKLPHSGRISLTFQAFDADQDPLSIGSVYRVGGAGKAGPLAVSQGQAATGKANIRTSTGQFALPIQGTAGQEPAYQVDVSLTGDVNGDFVVNNLDLQVIRNLIRTGGNGADPAVVAAAEINGNGRVDRGDLLLARQNLGASTSLRPLSVTVEVASSDVVGPGIVQSRTVGLVGATNAAASIAVSDNGSPYAPATQTDGSDHYATSLALTPGLNNLAVAASDSFGQRVIVQTSITRELVPVVLLPGFGASGPVAGKDVEFLLNRGLPPSDLKLEEFGDLIKSMEQEGYVLGVNLFAAPYDWRMLPAPTDGTNDGFLSGVTAQSMTDDVYEYGVDYLGYVLRQVVEANPDVHTVDILTHSTGGLVARSYIQSAAYGGTFTDNGQTYTLPKVNTLIMGSVPNEGASVAFDPWNNNFIENAGNPLGAGLRDLGFATYTLVADEGVSIPGPDYTIDKASITNPSTGKPDPTLFIHQYAPTISSLMATYNFVIQQDGTATNVNNTDAASQILLDLNALNSPGNNPWVKKIMHAVATYCVTTPTNTLVQTEVGEGGEILPIQFPPGAPPLKTLPGETWYLNELQPYGDTVVPLVSQQTTFIGDPLVTIQQWGQGTPVPGGPTFTSTTGPVTHVTMFNNTDIINYCIAQLLMS